MRRCSRWAGVDGSPLLRGSRGTLPVWRQRLEAWTASCPAEPGWLDFRPVHGQLWLGEALRAHLSGLASRLGCAPFAPGQDLTARLVDTARFLSLRLGLTRIASVERALAVNQLKPVGPQLANALEYLTAWQWVGEPLRRGPLARSMERMCRVAAWRAHDEMVAVVG